MGRIELITYPDPDPDGTGPLAAPQTLYTWDGYGRISTETGPDGLTTQYSYNSAGQVASITILDPDGTGPLNDLVTSFTYDAMGRQLSVTDPLGNTASATYDAAGRILTSTSADPDGTGPQSAAVTTFAYDALGRMVSQTDALGATTFVSYDDAGNQVATTNALGHTTSLAFDIVGRITSVTDPLGNSVSFTNDAASRLLTTTLPDPDDFGPLPAPTSSSSYDNLGQLVSTTGYDGGIETADYDSLGRLVATTAADGSTVAYTYNNAGQVLTITADDPDGSGPLSAPVTSISYDALGRAIQQTAADGSVSSTSYDDAGHVVSVTDAEGRVTSFGYDEFGRRTLVTDALGNTSATTYDDLFRVTSVTDGLGNSSTFVYDNLSQLISQTDANSGTTTTVFDALGRMVQLTDPSGNETSWTYDSIGQLLTDTNELGDSRTYSYDATGQLSSRTDRNGRIINFDYDNLGRQTSQQWLDGGIVVNTISTSYNADLEVAAISDNDSAYAFTRDAAGRLLSVNNAGTVGSPNVVLSSTYDTLGRQIGLSASIDSVADFVNTYTYDIGGAVSRVTQTDGSPSAGAVVSDKRVDLTYDDSGRFESIVRYADVTATAEVATTNYVYDATGRISNLTHSFGTTTLAGYAWAWDAADRITSYTSVLDGSVTFGYDNTGQLTSEARTDLGSNTVTTNYAFDANGNRTTVGQTASQTTVTSTYSTGTNNRTVSDGTFTYEYDAEGNRTKKTEISSSAEVLYVWNHANLLTDVIYKDSLGATTKAVEYQYDGLGRRIGKSVDENGDGFMDRSQTFIYDGAGLLAASGGSIQISGPNGQLNQHGWVDDLVLVFDDSDGDGSASSILSSRLLYGPAVDQLFAQESAAADVLWALTDHQGAVRDWVESADFDNNNVVQTQVINHLNFDAYLCCSDSRKAISIACS